MDSNPSVCADNRKDLLLNLMRYLTGFIMVLILSTLKLTLNVI